MNGVTDRNVELVGDVRTPGQTVNARKCYHERYNSQLPSQRFEKLAHDSLQTNPSSPNADFRSTETD
jgi:hypothetical protein